MAGIAPSILSADFGRLAEQIAAVEAAGAEAIHVDVMDGHFVPNLTIGPDVVRAVRRSTRLPLDIHLMIEEPGRWLEAFVQAGASWVSVHWEADRHLQRTLTRIRELGAVPGAVINPGTPVTVLGEVLGDVDFVLVMSVNPGFGGQSFQPRSLAKVRRLRQMIADAGRPVRIEIDGGIGEGNARAAVEAGADLLVAGSAVFGHGDPGEATRRLAAVANGLGPG
jgi:ribulose-phosphate 3-epimerase